MSEKNSFWKGALTGALAMLCAAVLAVGGYILVNRTELPGRQTDKVAGPQTEAKLEEIRQLIDSVYLHENEVDEDALTEGIYQGYIEALGDPYSTYYDEEKTKKLMEQTSGEFVGVGALMSQNRQSGIITIAEVYEGSPAEKAGMLVNDILYKVNGEEVTGIDLNDVVSKVRGESGTEVKMTVLRGGEQEEIELTAVRAKVETQTVRYEMKEDGIGYLRISEFDSVTYKQFVDAKQDLEAQGMRALIIDLRGNPGGNLDTVSDMLGEILPKGLTVYTEEKNGDRTDYWSEGKTPISVPLAVLANGSSASASEIFCGAVQDYGIGQIVGTTTYGKGVVQQLYKLQDGTIAKLTMAEYFTPKGRNIDGTGITPDVEVEYEADADQPEADNQLDKAMEIVRGEME